LGNLPQDVTEKMIIDIFGRCGDIKEIRLKRHNDTGKVKGYGFVEFTRVEEAEKAVKTLNNYNILGRNIKVEYSHMKRILPTSNPTEKANSISSIHEQSTTQTYSQPPPNAPVQNTLLLQNILSNPQLLTYIFLQQQQQQQQQLLAQQQQQQQQLLSQQQNLTTTTNQQPNSAPSNFSQQISRVQEPQKRRPQNCNTVFIGNLHYEIDNNEIRKIFSNVGKIKDIRWLYDKKTNKFKGCGFVEFYDPDSTVRAASLNGMVVLGRPMRVDYATERPESENEIESERGPG